MHACIGEIELCYVNFAFEYNFSNIFLLVSENLDYALFSAVRRISECARVLTYRFFKAFTAVRIIKSKRQIVQPQADFRRNSTVTIYFCSDVLIFVTIRFLTDF